MRKEMEEGSGQLELYRGNNEPSSNEPTIHPDFDSPDSDVILSARGGMKFFRVHSVVLKTSSTFFKTMFSLPRREEQKDEVIYLEEDEEVLDHLLRMVTGRAFLPIESYDLLDDLIAAIEKYDFGGPLSIIRILIMTPPFLDQPFRLYSVACRFGWEEEAKLASMQTLSYSLYDSKVRPFLERIPVMALWKILDLHRSRREGLRKRLNEPPFVSGGNAPCGTCGVPIDYHTWRELKYKIILEMDVRPLGDTILDIGLNEWPEAKACWTAKCPGMACSRSLYDKNETHRVIRDCIEKLPKAIA